ncbi:MAG: CHASE domain-containing protein [Bdellovibrionaceae bacterium]|nr:CHASE domain-containing protein [Bdellovibrionales bacterium]MCB9084339.1 CHASE domain-containing protein [Pseudobdellovibrionaceae bacterium]
MTALVTRFSVTTEVEIQNQHLNMAKERTVHQAKQILSFHEHVLLGLRGLYEASKSVERHEFAKFYTGTIKSRPEGIIGLGYIANVTSSDVNDFVKETQADNSSWFRLKFPLDKVQDHYWITTYHEPFDEKLIGLDASTIGKLQEALAGSLAKDIACVSDPIRLPSVQKDMQFLVVPVWSKTAAGDADSRDRVMGWVYSVIDIEEMFSQVGEHQDRIISAQVSLAKGSPNPNLFHSEFEYLGQTWQVSVEENPIGQRLTKVIGIHLAVGLCLSILLGLFVGSTTSSRRRAQKLADEKTLFLDKSQSVAHVGSWSYDIEGKILSWSDESYHIHEVPLGTKLNPDQAIGRYIGESQQRIGKAIEECVTKGTPFEGEFQLKTESGRVIWVWKAGAPLSNEPNCPTICGIIQDITERKELEESLQEERKIAMHASKLSALGEMAGGIAHEINNPLTVIVMAATKIRHLVEAKNTTEGVAEWADKIESYVFRIRKIVEGLRGFAREGSDDNIQSFPLRDLINDTMDFCEARFNAHFIDLKISVPDDVIISGRRVQYTQVLVNLLNNAFDAIKSKDKPWIHIEGEALPHGVELRVSDCGPGIPEDIREKVFHPFFTTKEVGEGTGLGLSISKGILESHGGSLSIDENADTTTFVLVFPYGEAKSQPTSRAA